MDSLALLIFGFYWTLIVNKVLAIGEFRSFICNFMMTTSVFTICSFIAKLISLRTKIRSKFIIVYCYIFNSINKLFFFIRLGNGSIYLDHLVVNLIVRLFSNFTVIFFSWLVKLRSNLRKWWMTLFNRSTHIKWCNFVLFVQLFFEWFTTSTDKSLNLSITLLIDLFILLLVKILMTTF